jgi:hypothetical protein
MSDVLRPSANHTDLELMLNMPLHHLSDTLLPSRPPLSYATVGCPHANPVMQLVGKRGRGWQLGAWTRKTPEEATTTAHGARSWGFGPSRGCGSRLDTQLPKVLLGRSRGGDCECLRLSVASCTCLLKYQYHLVAWIGWTWMYSSCFHDDIISKAPRWWTWINWLPITGSTYLLNSCGFRV